MHRNELIACKNGAWQHGFKNEFSHLIKMWDGDDEDGDDECGHDEDLEEPEAVVNSGANALARRHTDGHEAHGQEEEPDREGDLRHKKILESGKNTFQCFWSTFSF